MALGHIKNLAHAAWVVKAEFVVFPLQQKLGATG